MISQLDPASQQFLDNVAQLQSSLLRVQRQISSGVKIQRPSDGPDRVIDIVHRESSVARAVQIRQSMGISKRKPTPPKPACNRRSGFWKRLLLSAKPR